MKRILPLLICLLGLIATDTKGQWIPITNNAGTTQAYGAVSVTVSTVAGTTGGGCGGYYWTPSTNSSYTWAFSQPVDAIQIMCDAINTGESIQFIINGTTYNLQNCNVDQNQFVNTCSVGNCGIVGGQYVNNTANWVCGGMLTFYGPITTFTVLETVGGSGTTYNISFADLLATNNGPVCAPAPLNLTATNGFGTYNWTGPGGFNSNVQNPSIGVTQPSQSGQYIVTVGTNCGGTISDTTNAIISAPPVFNVNATYTDPTTCGGSNGTITITGLAPNAPYTVTYDVNGTPVSINQSSDANGTLIVSGLTQGTYTNIVASSPPCSATSPVGPFTLVDPPIPAAPAIASNSPVCENGTITLTSNSVPGATYNWSGPGFISNQQNPSITNAQMTSEGNYTATVTVANCVSPGSTIFVDMTPLPAAPVVTDVEYCQYEVAPPLTATGTALLWYTTQGGVGSSVAPTPNTGTPGVTTYWVTQTVSSCEGPTAAINVTIKPQPTAPVYTGPTHYCRDEPSTPLTANGQNIQWYDNNNNPLAGAPTVSTLVPADYTYYVTQSINGCESPKTTVQVHVADIPQAPGVSDITYCQFDEPVALTANGTALQWYNSQFGGSALIATPIPVTNVANVRTWFVSQTVDGCESPRAPITVTTLFLPTSTFGASRPLVCENDTLMFYYTGNGTNAELYTWTLPNDSTVLIDGNTDTPGPITIRFDSVGTFPLTLNVNNQGCNTTTVYNVKVVVVPVVVISMQNDICIHDTATIGLGDYNSPLATYAWDFDGGTNLYNDVNEGPYHVTWNGTGLHYVDVTVGNTACEATFHDTVLIHNLPDAHFAAALSGSGVCIGDSLRLTAVDNKGTYTYEWMPEGFFNQSNNNAPVVNAYVRAAQDIFLTVSTPYGCSSTEKMFIDAQQCCNVYLPNAFTPNGDGKNDIFRPVTTGTHAIKTFMIVDRWGKKVFETLDETKGWDGTFNGEDQDMGTFYYILQYKCDGKTQELKGEVILVR